MSGTLTLLFITVDIVALASHSWVQGLNPAESRGLGITSSVIQVNLWPELNAGQTCKTALLLQS